MSSPNQKSSRDLLFWSGGKDSYLALRYYMDETGQEPVLFTTFDDENGVVPHQNIPIESIRRQAVSLKLLLFTLPLSYPSSNEEYLKSVDMGIQSIPFKINHLIFGDLHLRDIRKWREKQFLDLGYPTLFPIWEKPIEELLHRLHSEAVDVHVSGVDPTCREFIKTGTRFDREFVGQLPSHIDPMGERGEFHTEIFLRG